MTIKAILWTYEKAENGQADIKIYSYPPKKYQSTGIKILPQYWDKKKGLVKKNHPAAAVLNAKIKHLINQRTINIHNVEGEGLLIQFLILFIDEAEKGIHPLKKSTLKNYKSTLTKLNLYCKHEGIQDIKFADCNLVWYANFCLWLFDHGSCKAPGIGKHAKVLKRILKLSKKRGLHKNNDYEDFTSDRRVSEKIYLQTDEIEKIYSLDLSGFSYLSAERDRFLVSYYLILRFGDSVRIQKKNAYKEKSKWFYSYLSEKTNMPVTVPISKRCRDILKRNDWDFSHCVNQLSNRYLKQIASLAGIIKEVKEGSRVGAKAMFVTTHTARRSAVTNMALEGVNIATIAKLGGWEQMKTLKHYLRASGVDVARAASNFDFFK